MKVLDILNAPWAIQPEKLQEIRAIYATHMRGEKIDIEAVEKRLGRTLDNQPKGYQVVNGVAVLPLEGVMAKRMNLMAQISGGTSTALAINDLRAIAADATVKSAIVLWDSPGGMVDGTQQLAAAIKEVSAVKPIVSLASGTMASAALWAGAAADAVYIADLTTQVGSIGIAMQHADTSGADAAAGVKKTDIYSGKFKRIASSNGPLSAEGADYLQAQADYMYSLMVTDIADFRGATVETVLKDMADGRVFIGQQAIDAGLVDGVSTLDALIAKLAAEPAGVARSATSRAGAAQTVTHPSPKGQAMNREEFAAAHPQLLEALLAEGRAAGAAAELARIRGIEATLIPGHEALIATLKFDGKSTPADAALAVNQAEQKVYATKAAANRSEAPAGVTTTPPPNDAAAGAAAAAEQARLDAMPVDERCKAVWEKDAAVRAEFGNDLGSYVAYTKANEAGRVRSIGRKG